VKPFVYLDFDGVIANWTGTTLTRAGKNVPQKQFISNYYAGNIGRHVIDEMMKSIDFWASIEPYSHAEKLVETINEIFENDWCFLTKGIGHNASFTGKAVWCEQYFPQYIKRLVITGSKKCNLCRHPSQFLIDDNVKNVEEWKKNNGVAYRWKEITDDWQEQADKQICELKLLLIEHKKLTF
jgi:5'(3')-deoxyribonucleotidase